MLEIFMAFHPYQTSVRMCTRTNYEYAYQSYSFQANNRQQVLII